MEYLILVAIAIVGVLLLVFFGQHRNRFVLVVSSVIEQNEKNGILVEGIVQSGWLSVSQGVFLKKENEWNYYSVIGIELDGNIRKKACTNERVKLMLTGSDTESIAEGSRLTTSKTQLEQDEDLNG